MVNKATPTVTTAPTASTITYGATLGTSSLAGGAGSVLGSFAWTNGITVPLAGTAPYDVTFTPTDTADYNTATTPVSLTVNKATPNIATVPTASSITYGAALGTSTLSGGSASSSSNPVGGTFAWTNGSTMPGAGTASYSVTFTPTDTADYTGATSSVSLIVNKATPTITTPPTASTITYGAALSTSTLSNGAAITPATLAAGTGATSVSLSIAVPQQIARLHTGETLGRMSLALLLLPFSGRVRRRMRKMPRGLVMLFVLIGGAVGVAGLTGCGSTNGFFGQSQQTYNVSVTGTSGALTHTTSVILIVQ